MRARRVFPGALVVALAVAGAARADSVSDEMSRFVRDFWSKRDGQFFAFSDHHSGKHGKYAQFWWQAQMWEAVIDRYRLTRAHADLALVKEVESGFKKSHPHWCLRKSGWWIFTDEVENLYNDDLGWWALACVHAYEATGDRSYLADARGLYSRIEKSQLANGSVTWRHLGGSEKPDRGSEYNVATNSLFIQLASGLARHDTNSQRAAADLARAVRCYDWLEKNLVSGDTVWDGIDAHGKLHRWQFSYDYGGVVASNLALEQAKHGGPYRARAEAIARAAIAKVHAGKLHDEDTGTDTDGTGFFVIFTRYLVPLARTYGLADVRHFLEQNAARFANEPLPGRVYRACAEVDARQQALLAR